MLSLPLLLLREVLCRLASASVRCNFLFSLQSLPESSQPLSWPFMCCCHPLPSSVLWHLCIQHQLVITIWKLISLMCLKWTHQLHLQLTPPQGVLPRACHHLSPGLFQEEMREGSSWTPPLPFTSPAPCPTACLDNHQCCQLCTCWRSLASLYCFSFHHQHPPSRPQGVLLGLLQNFLLRVFHSLYLFAINTTLLLNLCKSLFNKLPENATSMLCVSTSNLGDWVHTLPRSKSDNGFASPGWLL